MIKRKLALVLSMCLCMAGTPLQIRAENAGAETREVVEKGDVFLEETVEAGDTEREESDALDEKELPCSGVYNGIVWSLDTTGHLILEGRGGGSCGKNSPWLLHKDFIVSAEVRGDGWENSSEMFNGCSKLVWVETGGWDTGSIMDMSDMFNGCKSLVQIETGGWDTGNVVNMEGMFRDCEELLQLDVSGWDTGNVVNMEGMFRDCEELLQLDVSGWDTGNVTDMGGMFWNCKELLQLDVSGWDMGNVVNMESMFCGCGKLLQLDVNGWDTGNATDMNCMFSGCEELEELDVSGWNTGNVTDMGGMFWNCKELLQLDVSGWDMRNVSDMRWTFWGCEKLSTVITFQKMIEWRTDYFMCFDAGTATEPGSKIIVKYADNCLEEQARAIAATRSPNSHVYLQGEDVATAASVSLEQTQITLGIGATVVLTPTVTPVNAWEGYIWTSDNPSVAAVDEEGKITAAAEGIAVINITVGSVCAECKIIVRATESVHSGNWHGINWSLDENGKLTLEGAGGNYGSETPEWLDYAAQILTAEVKGSGMKSAHKLFYGCEKLESVDTSRWDTREIIDMSYMFYRCESLKSINTSRWKTDSVTNMGHMFEGSRGFDSLDVSGWNTANVTDMSYMFSGDIESSFIDSSLKELDVSGWNTIKVTDMSFMFSKRSGLRMLDVGGWDTRNVTNMRGMFRGCAKLRNLDVDGWDVSHVTDMSEMFLMYHVGKNSEATGSLISLEIGGWDVGRVTDMDNMFCGSRSLTDLEIGGWDVSQVTDMSDMFYGCRSLRSLEIGGWDVSRVTDMSGMFTSCGSLRSLEIGGWDVSHVIDMSHMFSGRGLKNLEIGGWDVGNVTDMGYMFFGSSLKKLDIGKWNTGSVTDMSLMFEESDLEELNASDWDMRNVTKLDDIFGQWYEENYNNLKKINAKNWKLESITSLYKMFANCRGLEELDVSNWDVSNITSMSFMFFGCSSLESLDVSQWDVSNVTDMSFMFFDCSGLKNLDVSNWNVGKIKRITYMFNNCSSLSSLDVSGWDTGNVTGGSNRGGTLSGGMNYMFNGCSSLNSLDVSNWDTGNVFSMINMFSGCISLNNLDVGSWNTSNVAFMDNMFSGCINLDKLDTGGWDMGSVESVKAMFDGCTRLSTDLTFQKNLEEGNFDSCFTAAATEPGSRIIVKYAENCSEEFARELVATKSENSHVYLEGEEVNVVSVFLDKEEITLGDGETAVLIPKVLPVNAWEACTWTSNNPSVALVDENGTVTAVANGTAVVKVTAGSVSAECRVTVDFPVSVTGVVLNRDSIIFTSEGETEQLSAEIVPKDATNQEVSWSSSDEDIVTVNETGLVMAVANGTAVITAATKDGGKMAHCRVTVSIPIGVTGVSLNKSSVTLSSVGATEKLTAEVTPSNASNKEVSWSSSDSSVATVSKMGLVTAVSNGACTITVTTEDGNKTAECKVTVAIPEKPGPENPTPEDPEPEKPLPDSGRIAGISRYSTAWECAEHMRRFSPYTTADGKFTAAVVACADNFPDALAGSTLAASVHAPILLVGKNASGTDETIKYINENVDKEGVLYLLGGTSAIPERVASSLASYGFKSENIITLAGSSRYETNLKIVDELAAEEGTDIVIVSGKTYADSLSVSGIAGAKGMPIFLAAGTLSEDAVSRIEKIAPKHIYVIGGTAAVSEEAFAQAERLCASGSGGVVRIAGTSRYATSLAVAEYFGMDKASAAVFAYGGDFPDGLTGGAFAAGLNAPVILVSDGNYKEQEAFLQNSSIEHTYIMGGTAAISDETMGHLMK